MMHAVARTSLTRELITRKAFELTKNDGLAGLSMRKLGAELGVEAMSLYHHVDSKADLLDALLEHLFAEIQLPVDVAETDWEAGLRRGMEAFRAVLVGHRGALELFATRPATGEQALEVLSWSVGRLVAVGLDERRASKALHFASSFVMGHAASEMGQMAISRSPEGRAGLEADQTPTSEFMRLTRGITPDEMFDSGLDTVVAGLRAQYHLP
jgi:AcrR family transcriptional regulator